VSRCSYLGFMLSVIDVGALTTSRLKSESRRPPMPRRLRRGMGGRPAPTRQGRRRPYCAALREGHHPKTMRYGVTGVVRTPYGPMGMYRVFSCRTILET
jgi:hypothetical protein